MQPKLPPLKPILMKDRLSVLFVEKGQLDVLDGAFVVVDKNGVRTHTGWRCCLSDAGARDSRLPCGGYTCFTCWLSPCLGR